MQNVLKKYYYHNACLQYQNPLSLPLPVLFVQKLPGTAAVSLLLAARRQQQKETTPARGHFHIWNGLLSSHDGLKTMNELDRRKRSAFWSFLRFERRRSVLFSLASCRGWCEFASVMLFKRLYWYRNDIFSKEIQRLSV